MKLTGKIFLLITINIYLIAGVDVSVNTHKITVGQRVQFTINAIGTTVKFPQISEIDGESVLGKAERQDISYINGVKLNKTSVRYTLKPEKSINIPSYEIEIDGKIEKTRAIKIEVAKATETKDPNFSLKITTNKKEAFVGEPILLTITYSKRIGIKSANDNYMPPRMSGFWTKLLKRQEPIKKGNFIIQKIEYSIFPQKSGVLSIDNAKVSVGILTRGTDMFAMFVESLKYKNIYSNSIEIKAKPLPFGVTLFGDYKIRVTVDKKEVKENEPVNVSVEVSGEGNIDDIKEFKIEIPDATVYKDKPKIETIFKNNKYQGKYIQKFAIIGDKNFEIPAFAIKFFKNGEIKRQSVKAIKIKVSKTTPSQKSVIIKNSNNTTTAKQKIVIKDTTDKEKLQYLLFGILIGVLVMVLIFLIKKYFTYSNKPDSNYVKRLLKTKGDKELLEALLPFVSSSKEIDLVVRKLEENLYKGFSHKINKKLLIKNIDRYIS